MLTKFNIQFSPTENKQTVTAQPLSSANHVTVMSPICSELKTNACVLHFVPENSLCL